MDKLKDILNSLKSLRQKNSLGVFVHGFYNEQILK